MDFEQILNMLFQFIGGSGSGYQRVPYQGTLPYHISQSYSYNEGPFEQLTKQFFPFLNRQQQPPWFIGQRDFSHIMQRSQELNTLRQNYTMGNAGVKGLPQQLENLPYYQNDPRLINILSQVFTSAGMTGEDQAKIFGSMPYNMLAGFGGPMLFGQGPAQREFSVLQDLSRYFGAMPNRSRTGGFTAGLPTDLVRDITKDLFNATYTDKTGMFKKMPFFEMEDMADIMKLGLDTGMEMPLNKAGSIDTDRLMRNTQNLAKVIQAGMSVFQTMDKEEVLQNIMELTRGKVAITDTAQLESILHRVNAVAKSINLNTKFMQKMAAEGAALFEQLNLPPQAGALITSEIIAVNKGLTSGPGSIFSPQQVAQLGGTSELRKAFVGQAAEMYTSRAYRTTALAAEAERSGLIDRNLASRIEASYNTGNIPFSMEAAQLRENLIRKKMDEIRHANKGLPESSIRLAAEDQIDRLEKIGMENRLMEVGTGRRSFVTDITSQWRNIAREAMYGIRPDEANRLISDLQSSDAARKQNAVSIVSSQLRSWGRSKGMAPQDLDRYVNTGIGVLSMTDEQRRIQEDLRIFRRTEELANQAAQENFAPQGLLDIFTKTMFQLPGYEGANLTDAFFRTFKPEMVKLFTTAQLNTEFSPQYQRQLSELTSPERVDELARMMLEYYSKGNEPLKNYLEIASSVSGVTYMGRGTIRKLIDTEKKSRNMTETERTKNFDSFKEHLKNTYGISELKMDDLKKEMQDNKGTFSTFTNYLSKIATNNKKDLISRSAIDNTELLKGYMTYLYMNDTEDFSKRLINSMQGLDEITMASFKNRGVDILTMKDKELFGDNYDKKLEALKKSLVGDTLSEEDKKLIGDIPDNANITRMVTAFNKEIQRKVSETSKKELDTTTDKLLGDKKNMFESIKKIREIDNENTDKRMITNSAIKEMGFETSDKLKSGLNLIHKIMMSDKKEDVRDMLVKFANTYDPTKEETKYIEDLEIQARSSSSPEQQRKLSEQISEKKYEIFKRSFGGKIPQELMEIEDKIKKARESGLPASEIDVLLEQRGEMVNKMQISGLTRLEKLRGYAPILMGMKPEELQAVLPKGLKPEEVSGIIGEFSKLQEQLKVEEAKVLQAPSEEIKKASENFTSAAGEIKSAALAFKETISAIISFAGKIFGISRVSTVGAKNVEPVRE